MVTKSGLGIVLSRLKGFDKPKVRVEQYEVDAEIAADVLWQAKLIGDIGDMEKVSVDLGCGTGLLGIGALVLGAKKVYFVESDSSALDRAKANWKKVESEHKTGGKAVFLCQDIREFSESEEKIDVVIENPPFGTKVRHSDRIFLEKAVKLAPVVYSFHKSSTKKFIEGFCRDNDFMITHVWDFNFPIKASQKFHKRKIHRIEVSCFRLERKN